MVPAYISICTSARVSVCFFNSSLHLLMIMKVLWKGLKNLRDEHNQELE